MKNSLNIWVSKHWLGLFSALIAFFGLVITYIVYLYNIQLGICHERLEMCKDRMAEIRALKDDDFKQYVLIVRGSEKERRFIEQYGAFLIRQFKSEK